MFTITYCCCSERQAGELRSLAFESIAAGSVSVCQVGQLRGLLTFKLFPVFFCFCLNLFRESSVRGVSYSQICSWKPENSSVFPCHTRYAHDAPIASGVNCKMWSKHVASAMASQRVKDQLLTYLNLSFGKWIILYQTTWKTELDPMS